MESEQWHCQYSQDKPNVEIQQQISNVKRPRLGSEDFGASTLAPKNVIGDDIPRHNGQFLEECRVDCDFSCLRFVSKTNKYKDESGKITNITKHLTTPLKMRPIVARKEPEIKPMTTSSTKRGTINAPANGQPTIAPSPNHMIPCAVLKPSLQSKKAARPNIDVSMVKLDGRKEAEA